MHLRLFCALTVPADLQDRLVAASHSLRGSLSPSAISWVKGGSFHLTLFFLGDVEESRLDELKLQLRAACEPVGPFELVCQGLGCFPTPNRPRVLWAGVADAGSDLAPLQNRVAAACAAFAPQEEKRRFHGHITLGRFRANAKPSREALAREIERNRDVVFGRWPVNQVELLCSDLSQGAPRYTLLHRFPLS